MQRNSRQRCYCHCHSRPWYSWHSQRCWVDFVPLVSHCCFAFSLPWKLYWVFNINIASLSVNEFSLIEMFQYFQPLVKFKSHLYYEDKDKITEALKSLKIVPGSKILFFKNGQPQGVAFANIYGGAYYPAISIYKNATVSVNFGPSFKYPETEDRYRCKGVSKMPAISIITFRLIVCVCV